MEAVADQLAMELTRTLGGSVVPNQRHVSENRHFAGAHPQLGRLFIKVYGSRERFTREGDALEILARHHAWVLAPVREGDLSTSGHFWRAFPEVAMHPFTFDLEGCRTAAQLLADVHGTDLTSTQLPTKPHGWELVPERLAAISRWPSVHEKAARLAQDAALLLDDLSRGRGRRSRTRLLTEDFGVRNIHVREDDGTALLIDFEHAERGDPHWDLGKVWDQELVEPARRNAFVGEYRRRTGLRDWPDVRALWATRFAAALAILPYAARVGDAAFFDHGVEKLHRLDAELPGLLL
ncbi:aminoglycoside phosphotransferase family protein [Isoptericola cucumis]|uniref:aminoglycoside phosphotransferase family protein n=1 Tax=Isoptericola cucumis TaxID=1776856 RepID=UPI00320A6525